MTDPFDAADKGLPGRIALEDAAALDELRQHVFESVGPKSAPGILYGIGLAEGLVDGARIARGFLSASTPPPALAGPPLGLLFSLERACAGSGYEGHLRDSIEARLHLGSHGSGNAPVCALSAGYSAGWYSAITGEDMLVLERACAGCGDSLCRVEARTVEQWREAGEERAEALLLFLDFAALRERAQRQVESEQPEGEDEIEGSMMGAFDAMSPAVHVWGPVMVLPYSGREDSSAAVETIEADVGRGAIRVAVVDLTGARIAGAEARGVYQLVDLLEAHEIETVLVGLPDLASPPGASSPIRARDISEGIALAFQLANTGLSEPS